MVTLYFYPSTLHARLSPVAALRRSSTSPMMLETMAVPRAVMMVGISCWVAVMGHPTLGAYAMAGLLRLLHFFGPSVVVAIATSRDWDASLRAVADLVISFVGEPPLALLTFFRRPLVAKVIMVLGAAYCLPVTGHTTFGAWLLHVAGVELCTRHICNGRHFRWPFQTFEPCLTFGPNVFLTTKPYTRHPFPPQRLLPRVWTLIVRRV